MPDVSYEIIIREVSGSGGTGSGTPSGGGGAPAPSDSGGSGKGTPSDTGWLNDIYGSYKTIKGFAPIAAATSVAKNIFQWQVGLVGRNMGNSLVQEKINYGMQLAGQIGSSVGMFGLGAALGNPLMMIAGVTSGINTLIGYAQQREQFNYDRNMENVSRALLMERAGPSFNRSRTEV